MEHTVSTEATNRNSTAANLAVPRCGIHMNRLSLPEFIAPPPTHLTDVDITYLIGKSATELPPVQLRSVLLSVYIQRVFWILPTPPLEMLVSISEGRHWASHGPISLLLFQAIMFAAVPHVELEELKEAGFESKFALRAVLEQKVKALYNLGWEIDRLDVIQTVLLMSYGTDTCPYWAPQEHKDKAYWLQVAISMCQSMKLHRGTTYQVEDCPRRRTMKRTWWACFVMDHSVPGRRPQIYQRDWDAPLLCENDLELGSLPQRHSPDEYSVLVSSVVEVARACVRMNLSFP